MTFIDQIKSDFTINASDPIDRVVQALKLALKHYPTCREFFLSTTPGKREEGALAGLWLIEALEKEIINVEKHTHLNFAELMNVIYQDERMTPIECQQYLQANAWIVQNKDKIFAYRKEKEKPSVPKKLPKTTKHHFANKLKI